MQNLFDRYMSVQGSRVHQCFLVKNTKPTIWSLSMPRLKVMAPSQLKDFPSCVFILRVCFTCCILVFYYNCVNTYMLFYVSCLYVYVILCFVFNLTRCLVRVVLYACTYISMYVSHLCVTIIYFMCTLTIISY